MAHMHSFLRSDMNPSLDLAQPTVLTPDRRLQRYLLVASIALLALFLYSFAVGPHAVPVETVVGVLLHRLHLVDKIWSDTIELLILNVRGPRIAAAMLVGGGLSMVGATYQELFRNPPVSPAVLGVSAGAGFGAALGVMGNFSTIGIQGMAFACGLVAVAMAVGLGQYLERQAMLVMVRVGMVVSAFFQALIALLKVRADPLNQLPTITLWLLGGLHRMTAQGLFLALWPMLSACVVLYALRWQVHALTAGDDEARTLGIDVTRVRLFLI